MFASPRLGRPARLLALASVTALLLAGCAAESPAGTDDAGTPVPGGSLVFARTAAPTDLDLHTQITANNAFAIDKIFEPLFSFNAAGEIEPWLATEATASDDGLVWTIALREGVTFSDGSPLTAADVVFSLQRHLETGGPLPLHAPITDIAASDEQTVTVTLSEAYTPFLAELSQFSNGILPENFGGVAEADFFQDPVGTGPFSVGDWETGGDLTLAKNEHYWQEGKPYLDEVVYALVPDDNQLIAQVQGGQAHVIDQVAAANIAELQANDRLRVSLADSWEVEQLFFNTKDEHFSDRAVRRAVAQVIDREGLTAATSFGTATAAEGLLPPTIEYSGGVTTLPVDVAKAKAELRASAFPEGFSTTILVASGNTLRAQEAQIIQEALAQIDITVTIESVDLAAFRERFKALDYAFMLNSGLSDLPDPNGLVTFQADVTAGSSSYWTSYDNPEVASLIAEGRSTPPGEARGAIYTKIQDLIAQDAPYLPLSYKPTVKAAQASVHGLEVLPNGSTRLQGVWLDGE